MEAFATRSAYALNAALIAEDNDTAHTIIQRFLDMLDFPPDGLQPVSRTPYERQLWEWLQGFSSEGATPAHEGTQRNWQLFLADRPVNDLSIVAPVSHFVGHDGRLYLAGPDQRVRSPVNQMLNFIDRTGTAIAGRKAINDGNFFEFLANNPGALADALMGGGRALGAVGRNRSSLGNSQRPGRQNRDRSNRSPEAALRPGQGFAERTPDSMLSAAQARNKLAESNTRYTGKDDGFVPNEPIGLANPQTVRTSQWGFDEAFQRPFAMGGFRARTVSEAVEHVTSGRISRRRLQEMVAERPLVFVERQGKVYSLDHRRLIVFRRLKLPVPFVLRQFDALSRSMKTRIREADLTRDGLYIQNRTLNTKE